MLTSLPAIPDTRADGERADAAALLSRPPSVPAALAETAPVVDEMALALQERAVSGALRAAPTVLGAGVAFAVAAAAALGHFGRPIETQGWIALALLVALLRWVHVLRSRSALPRPSPARWVPRYLAGMGAGTLLWAALPWLSFAAAEP
ncbi:hypothetical protein, partial [Variovorax sp. YR752]|uniref:hypothetical protein n=1 Tax=Variovorax sp. YR752 TaxID=1884383 RepID=UPI0031383443